MPVTAGIFIGEMNEYLFMPLLFYVFSMHYTDISFCPSRYRKKTEENLNGKERILLEHSKFFNPKVPWPVWDWSIF